MINKLKKEIRRVFLVDAFGALISAVLLGIVLPFFQKYIGLPNRLLILFALMACLIFLYSLFFTIKPPTKPLVFIKTIALVNFSYCILTISTLLYYLAELQFIGLIYFSGEILVLLFLIRWEWKIAEKFSQLPR